MRCAKIIIRKSAFRDYSLLSTLLFLIETLQLCNAR